MNIRDKLKNPLITNLLLAIVVSCILVYGALKWLDSYTLHNTGVKVPKIKGLPIAEAARFMTERGLRHNIVDSIYYGNGKPGTVVEVVPPEGTNVKPGRIIYVTIKATGSPMAAVPAVKDLSFRQAYALLKALGFESVEVEYVPGTYKDLAQCVELRGRVLEEGQRVSLSAPLSLIVSNGTVDISETEAEENAEN
jgi:beta-lactam-binding protein with PASTA domain